MNFRTLGTLGLSWFLLAMIAVGCESGSSSSRPPEPCGVAAPEALRTCIGAVNESRRVCYLDSDAPCDASAFDAPLAALKSSVEASCSDSELGSLSVAALVGRLQTSCVSETQSIGSRTFGGPQGAVWSTASESDKNCLRSSHETVETLVDEALAGANQCLAAEDCDADALDTQTAAAASSAIDAIESACAALEKLIAVPPDIYVERAMHQVDCMLATSHADTAPLTLSCGPSNVDMDPPRGEYQQIIVDGDKWGTLCGDGTPYAFQIRLAPEGEPLDKVIIGLQGGGVCFEERDCGPRLENENSAGLFNALDDEPFDTGVGLMSTDPAESPFANWTKVYLPYCNQDVFTGPGVTENFTTFDLPRYGAVNLRSAIQMVRDLLWKLKDEEGGDGFRPDEVVTLFGGWSAGGYGVLYNYHWLLDDLQWPRTTAFPDAGGALDNGTILSVRTVGLEFIPKWGALPNLPPYCFVGDCAVGPFMYGKTSPRLKAVPEQQMLILSNQKDNTQQGDAFFVPPIGGELGPEAFWMNTLRQNYCDTKDLNGIHYYYSSESKESVHVISLRPEFFEGEVAGISLSDWMQSAMSDPDKVVDRAEEGTFVDDIPGTAEFPCEVAP
ncbi:MAG: pectin acetylesterase-family hydrolase [Polyangiales bacterium]